MGGFSISCPGCGQIEHECRCAELDAFWEKVCAAKERVRLMDEQDCHCDRDPRTIFLALESGLRSLSAGGPLQRGDEFDALVMLADLSGMELKRN